MRKLYPLLNVYVILVIMMTLTGWLISCQEKEEFIPLKIFSVEPAEALIGDTIQIVGEGFSPGIRYNQVFFPGVGNTITPANNSTQNRLSVVVPEKARTGPLMVRLFDEVAESPLLTVKVPVIESVEPADGLPGDTVTIRGSNFRPEKDKNAVQFNPESPTIAGATVVSASGTELKVIVPLDSRTGKISVLGFEGPEFTIFPPSITRIEPLECIVGDTITITGRGLNVDPERTDILFSGSAARATLLPGNTSKKLQVIVHEDAKDGAIIIRYPGNELVSEESLMVYPSITEVSPGSGAPRTPVTINGYGFSTVGSANIVKFGGVAATDVSEISEKQLRAVVPTGADTGPLTVEVNGRMISGTVPVFEISSDGSPLIFEIDPPSGPVGTFTYLTGDYFSTVKAENIVKFNSDSVAEVVGASRTQLKVKIPYGAVNGPVTVTVGTKKGTGPKFTLTSRALPKIESITPAFVEPGGEFTIRGVNFAEFIKDIALSLQSGDAGNRFLPLTASAEMITARMPIDLPTGEYPLQLAQYGEITTGTITIARQPVIESISPAEGAAGTIVVLTGQNFHNIDSKNAVKFGDHVAVVTGASNNDDERISVQVPQMIRGEYNVTVTAFGGRVSNSDKTFRLKAKPTDVKNVYYGRRVQQVSGSASPATYWIEKASYEGESVQNQVIYTVNTPTSNPSVYIRSLVADLTDEKVYFSLGASSANLTVSNTLGWSNLNNPAENGTLVLPSTGSEGKTSYMISELSLDAGGDILFCARNAGTTNWELLKGNVTPSASAFSFTPAVLTHSGNSAGVALRGITYCPENSLIYLCEQTATSPSVTTRIRSVNAGGILTEVVPPGSVPTGGGGGTGTVIIDFKIDYENKKIFMLCAASPSGGRRRIVTADLNNSRTGIVGSVREFFNIESEPSVATLNGIALDTRDKYVYWIKYTTETTTVRPSGVYRQRYDLGLIPGSDPDGSSGPETEVNVEFLYPVENQAATNVNVFGGLAIEESTGGSSSQRRRSSSQRISLNFGN